MPLRTTVCPNCSSVCDLTVSGLVKFTQDNEEYYAYLSLGACKFCSQATGQKVSVHEVDDFEEEDLEILRNAKIPAWEMG